MTTEITKTKLKTIIAKRLRDNFINIDDEDVGFVFIGNTLPYANSDYDIIPATDSEIDEREVWNNMIVAKKVNPGDVELVIPRRNWITGRKYKQYDDLTPIPDLLESDGANNIYSMIVMNSEGNVYKCLSNNNSQLSVNEPTNNYSLADGFIETADGYIWKYLYNVRPSNKFLTETWMPVPFTNDVQSNVIDYDINDQYNVPGSLNVIVIENGGNNYVHTTTVPFAYVTGDVDISLLSLNNVAVNMTVTGDGILPDTYITELVTETTSIRLSQPTISGGGGGSNTISILTRAVIEGDGVDAVANVILDETTVSKIELISMGTDFSYSNVFIYGTATSNVAEARAIISPKFGHGYNPAIETGAESVMVVKRVGETDSTEEGMLSNDISFRQYGLLINPYKYNENSKVSYHTSNNIIAQTHDLTLESGGLYSLNDFVYQGTIANPNFSGYVVSQDSLTVKLTNCKGIVDIGSLLTNGVISRPVTYVKYPDLEPYSGEIMYISNVNKIQRADGQSEELKITITV